MNCVFVIAKPSMANMIRTTTKILRICAFMCYSFTPSAAGIPEFHGDCVDAGRRAASDTRISSATVIHEDTIEEPPAARNGAVRPVSGMRRVMPPSTTKSWTASEKLRPVARSLPNPSRTVRAARRPRWTRIRYRIRIAAMPVRPSSSAREERMKSELASGTWSGYPRPHPAPMRPPDAWPKIPCASW